MKVKAFKVKNIRWSTLASGFQTRIGTAGKNLVAFAPDSFGGCWFSITKEQLK